MNVKGSCDIRLPVESIRSTVSVNKHEEEGRPEGAFSPRRSSDVTFGVCANTTTLETLPKLLIAIEVLLPRQTERGERTHTALRSPP